MLKSFFSIIFGIFFSFCAFAQGNLIFAIDIVRHGDRTPMIASPEMQKIWPQGLGQLTPKGMRQALLNKSIIPQSSPREMGIN